MTSILAWAVVALSSSFMRSAPAYDAELDNQLMMGALVETLETQSYWIKVKAHDYTGWVTEMAVYEITDEEKDAYLEAAKWICVAEYARIRETPSENSSATKATLKPMVSRSGTRTGKRWLSVPPAGTETATRWTDMASTPSYSVDG